MLAKLCGYGFDCLSVVSPVAFAAMFNYLYWLMFAYGSDCGALMKAGTLFLMGGTTWLLYFLWWTTRN